MATSWLKTLQSYRPLRNDDSAIELGIRRDGELDPAQIAREEDSLLPGPHGRKVAPRPRQARLLSIPRPLLYLVSIPVIIFVLWIIKSLFQGPPTKSPLLWNGKDYYHPTTLVISLDGFRASYLTSYPGSVPNLLRMANSSNGLRAESLQPRFPSLTFPNHWSIMTGLEPESHGIVANDFVNPSTGEEFKLADLELVEQGRWWGGEPMWSVAERAGRKTANLMWAGPPITSQGISPTYFVPFDDRSATEKPAQIFDWLDMSLDKRPELIFAYIYEIDIAGHKGGPDSDDVQQALELVDGAIGSVLDGLEERNLTDIVNLIVLSDHGMAATSNDRLIYLDDILGDDFDSLEHRDGWPLAGLRFKQGIDTSPILSKLEKAAEESGHFNVYTQQTMPEHWNFNTSDRIAPIYLVQDVGWSITTHREMEDLDGNYQPNGVHGYNNFEEEMQAIFFAQGPFVNKIRSAAEAHSDGAGKWYKSLDPLVLQSFSNLEIFSLVMGLMGLQSIEPSHNGTDHFWAL